MYSTKEHIYENSDENRTVAIMGLGYVGLPLALLFSKHGFRVIGIDPDSAKIAKLQNGGSYIHEVSDADIREAIASERFLPTSQYSASQAAEAVIICVPTPLTAYGTPDLSYLTLAAAQIGTQLRKGQLVVLESSTYPGTTKEVLMPLLGKSGLRAGEDFHVAYSPERVDPGNERFPLQRIPKIVSGISERCLERVSELYRHVFPQVHPVSSTDAAEMTKILENAYRLINISFINEMAIACDKLGLDVWEVVTAASTKPFGYHPFYPGPGIGGHCIPVDPSYLQWRLKKFGMDSEFIGIANGINHRMPLYIIQQLKQAIAPKPLADSSILVYGAAYKPDIADYRESASIDLMELLRLEGAKVYYHDPYVPKLKVGELAMASSELTPEFLGSLDGVIIATNHSVMPLDELLEYAPLVYDSRNATSGRSGRAAVIRLGGGEAVS
ncbi:nucleotide sugar dehydrogenase [Paenibacillus sp. LHD-117]|uniref:nucleotide sugar dehydrogenase n=1 Tax=Paenibacillus sp. LHD-117 TaxID=3071412 RepID=UPI0027E0E49C|nr:nucleotide sugar dehydrogenase [Paenibacillus sp. LHD-117]MDQ6418332.1 nucleotide sugar dehydrogenase [Paenibacillus sp. LHD-117]